MSPERWQKIEEVFQAVVDLAPTERLAFLTKNHADDEDLIAEINKLISDYEEAGDFIESPVWTDSFMLGPTIRDHIGGAIDDEIKQDNGAMIGRRLGVYLLTAELGRGGMGAVYLAERADGEFRQRVALKVIKRGMDTDFIVRRFRNERQILASLDHPNIARLLDGGTTSDGLPFFVMEHIEGEPVYKYSDAKRLNINERLQLFVRICGAVDYAHQNLIIHRDIKPTNILITADGTPKLLDFGIAKILDPELAADSIDPTATSMRMMTPEYASPEQVRGEPVTKVSDIYSLGVLLYELLTGHRPYRLKNRALHEIARVICEEEPDNLGASLTREDNLVPTSAGEEKTTLEFIFEARNASRESLERELSGELERVVFKALRKDPHERYSSAAELAEDILRYLQDEPVLAPSFYQSKTIPAPSLQKTNFDEISVAVLPLKLFGAGAREDTGDDFLCIGLADALITRLSNVRRFIVRPTSSVLKYGNSDTEPITAGEELGVDYVIDGNIRRVGTKLRVTVQLLNIREGAARWAEKFDEEFTDVLSLEDSISEKVAEALLPQLTGDERAKLKKRGTDSNEAFENYLRGRHHWNSFTEDGFAKAIVAYHQAIAFDPNYAMAYAGIADYYNWLGVYGVLPSKECFQAATENAKKALELDETLAEAYSSLGFAQHGGNFDWTASERNFQTALRLNPNSANTRVWYSIKLTTEGRFSEGLEHANRAIQLDPQTPFNQHNLGWCLYFARQFDKSLKQYRRTAELHPVYPLAYYGLACVLRYIERREEALQAAARARELMSGSVFSLLVEGQTFAAAGMRDEAENILEKLAELSEKQFVSPYHTAMIYAFLNEKEKALDFLEKCLQTSEAWLVWLGVEPAFDGLRSETRFVKVLEYTKNPILERVEKPSENIAGEIHQSHIATKVFPSAETTVESPNKTTTKKFPLKKSRQRFWLYSAAALVLLGILTFFSFRGIQKTDSGYELTFGADSNKPLKIINEPNLKTIAVLPFETDADYENEKSFAVGLAESVGEKLRQVKELSVRLAFLKLKNNPNLEDLAKNYSVNYVLRGKLHVENERVKVNAELVNTNDGKVLWLENFDEKLSDFQNLQTAISERVLKALTIELSANERQQISKNYTQNSEAYQLYLVGRYQLSNRSAENLNKAIKTFEKSRNLDPKFALAYAGLADAYALLNLYQIPPPADAYQKAKINALKAIELDANLAEAHASLGYVLFYDEHKRDEAVKEIGRAIELNPSYSTAYHWLALMLSAMGKHDEAIRNIKSAIELEPRSAIIQTAAGLVYFYARQYDDALKIADKVLENNEGFVPAYKTKRVVYEAKGNYSAALSAYQNERIYSENTDENDEGWMMISAQVQAVGGNREEALTSLKRATQNSMVKNNPKAFAYEIALAYALLGENDAAIEWLKKSKDVNSYGFNFTEVDARFDKIRGDSRFDELSKISE